MPDVPAGGIVISIHALRKESDRAILSFSVVQEISIHALRKESDHLCPGCAEKEAIFQSTLSVRRATGSCARDTMVTLFQSTLSVRRATVQLDIFVHFLRRKPAAWL